MIVRNFSFNFAGRLLPIIISLIAVPIYVRYLGIANYALVGIFASFSAFAGIFDIGFSNTINRELARDSGAAQGRSDLGALFRTLEAFAWIVALVLGAGLIGLAGPIVHYWLAVHTAPVPSLLHGVELMGLLLMLQAPTGFYNGALYGMHAHGTVNTVQVVSSFLSATATIVVLAFVAPTIEAFFITQFVCRSIMMLISRQLGLRMLAARVGKGSMIISWRVWRTVWRFALSMNGLGVLSIISSQADMIILSRMLPLKEFGYYTLARILAQGLTLLGSAVMQASFPHFAKLAGEHDQHALNETYIRYSQLQALIVIPAMIIMIFDANDLLLLWTHNPEIAEHIATLLALLALGWGLNALGSLQSAVLLVYGAADFIIALAIANLLVMLPLMFYLTSHFGPLGAGLSWAGINLLLMFVGQPLFHLRYMKGQFLRWLKYGVVIPFGAALVPAALLRLAFNSEAGYSAAFIRTASEAAVVFFTVLVALPQGRARIKLFLFKRYIG